MISVHALSEYAYCPRAGVIAHELAVDDEIDEPPKRFNLDYAPPFHLEGIEEAIGRLTESLTKLGLGGLVVLLTALLMFVLGFHVLLIPLGVVVAVLSWIAAKRINRIVELTEWREQARNAAPREPSPTAQSHQKVNWWEILAAGFESIPGRESYVDSELGLAGRPWRVLRKGSLRIPVIKLQSTEDRSTPQPQHAIRVAAYCRLLQLNEGMESPYAVLLFGDSWDGLAVANTESLQKRLPEAVAFAREMDQLAQQSPEEPPSPQPPAQCVRCQYGRPVEYRVEQGSPWWDDNGQIHGMPFGGKTFHSCCGDRFGWTPPHEQSLAMKLTD